MTGMEEIAPLISRVYQDRLMDQLNRETVLYNRINGGQDEERKERLEAWRKEEKRKRKELLDLLSTATGTVKLIVELHSVEENFDECEGCDFGGYEGDKPSWPCRTIELIAEELRNGKE